MLALSLSQSRDPDTREKSLKAIMVDHQICIFALQSVFVCGMCNIGKNPCLLRRQAQMNAFFLLKFSLANDLYINIFYFITFYYHS